MLTFSKIAKKTIRIVIVFTIIIGISILGIKWAGKVMYPLEHREYISKYSDKYNIDPFLVASIIRVESKFDEEAKSHKGATGLMQITPSTGKWIADIMGINDYKEEMLYEPETNISFGCWYVNNLKAQFNGNIKLALAAYNGGSGNVTKWLANKEYSSDGLNLDKIPFRETEQYVYRVLKDYKIYRKLYDYEDLYKE